MPTPLRRVCVAGAALSAAVAATATVPLRAAAGAPAGPAPAVIGVQGSLGGITVSPAALTPAFSLGTHDYVVRCSAGTTALTVSVSGAAGSAVGVGPTWGQSVDVPVSAVEGQAIVVQAQDAGGAAQEYWIRCLPHDFPALGVSRPGSPTPGWYLTGNAWAGAGETPYAMILDTNGTPVWYAAAPNEVLGLQPVSATAVAWSPNLGGGFGVAPNPGISVVQMDGSGVQHIVAANNLPTDHHELLQLPGGGVALLAYPIESGVDLSSIGLGTNQNIVDCAVQEENASGALLWQWRASDHVAVDESMHPQANTINGETVYDIYHCNSIDEDGAGHVLVSVRQCNAVYEIDHATGTVLWKLGGTAANKDGARIIAITGDPETTIDQQHDARYLPDGHISVFDDHTALQGAARGVEYAVDAGAGTAGFVWQYARPDNTPSAAMGSFRRYADGSNVIGWGTPGPAFTDVDDSGRVQLEVTLPGGGAAYRAIKVPLSTFDLTWLRRTAGLDSQPLPPPGPGASNASAGTGAVGMASMTDLSGHDGYWIATAAGRVGAFGAATFHGDTGGARLNAPVVGIAATPGGGGYWLAAADGGVFSYGDARFLGSMGGVRLNQPIVGIEATPDGGGYWLVAADGGIFSFGDAPFLGSTGAIRLNQPVVGMARSSDGGGYWLVARDGGIFAFGDAPFLGSMGAVRLNQPVVGMARRPDTAGYWLVAADGGIFAFNAPFEGSMGATPLAQPVTGMASPAPTGYWMLGRDGGVFSFGTAPYLGRVTS